MLTELCQELHNWFCDIDADILITHFKIEDGHISPEIVPAGYIRIVGSAHNDGVHLYGDSQDVLTDEEFTGAVWIMHVPRAVVELAERIKQWNTDNAKVIGTPYTSESWGGYSYTKGGTGSVCWQNAFVTELNRWRKL